MADQQELNPEEMSLEQLKAAALAEEAKEDIKELEKPPADMELPAEDAEKEIKKYTSRSEIDFGDGSGMQVFEAEGLTPLEAAEAKSLKLVEAQRNATLKIRDDAKKIRELNAKIEAQNARTEQQKTDDAYVLKQRLDKEPDKVIDERIDQRLAAIEAMKQRNLDAQQAFVDSHPEYIADPTTGNGARMMSEYMRLNPSATEFTEQGLEKAYQSLKASGLLKIKAEEAGGTTEDQAKEAQRIAETKVEATQPRSPKRSSTVSMRGASPTVIKTGLTEDELYALPLDQLKKISNEQLAKAGGE